MKCFLEKCFVHEYSCLFKNNLIVKLQSILALTVESYDRSTAKEYESLNKDLTQKYDTLKASKEKAMKHDDEQFKSILKQVSLVISLEIPLL